MTAFRPASPVVVIISADAEWAVAQPRLYGLFGATAVAPTPYGAAMAGIADTGAGKVPLRFIHGGWGKIDAAGSAQYAIDRWKPSLLVNLGTCGGFEGAIARETVILVTRTLVYDIIEQMGDPDDALAHYAVDLDLSWLKSPYPIPVEAGLLLSADRDLVVGDIHALQHRFGGVAGDWESGAIAHVTARNGTRCLILRGVTDLVGQGGGEAYDGTAAIFRQRADAVMARLLDSLPAWLARVTW